MGTGASRLLKRAFWNTPALAQHVSIVAKSSLVRIGFEIYLSIPASRQRC